MSSSDSNSNNKKGRGELVLVTGGTSGVGLECCKALVAQGYQVIATGRDVERGNALAQSVGMTFKKLELGSLKDVRRFVEELRQEIRDKHLKKTEEGSSPPVFTTVIANAGLQMTNSLSRSEDGFEKTFAANHLGHFVLVQLLLAAKLFENDNANSYLLRRNPTARIVLVSSGAHDPAQKTPIEPPKYVNAEKPSRGEYDGLDPNSLRAGQCCYSTSKLCNALFAFELSRRLHSHNQADADVVVNAFDPGLTPGTSLAREAGPVASFLFRHAPVSLLRTFIYEHTHPVEDSGTSLARLATSPDFAKVSGKYFEHRNLTPFVRESSRDSLDEAKAKDLWDTSMKLANIQPNETIFH